MKRTGMSGQDIETGRQSTFRHSLYIVQWVLRDEAFADDRHDSETARLMTCCIGRVGNPLEANNVFLGKVADYVMCGNIHIAYRFWGYDVQRGVGIHDDAEQFVTVGSCFFLCAEVGSCEMLDLTDDE